MSFKSAEGSKFIDVDLSFVKYPTAQGLVEFPAGIDAGLSTFSSGLTAGDVDIDPTGIVNAEEFRVAPQVYLASTGVEAPLGDFGDVVASNLIEAKNLILLTADEGGVITFEDGTSQSTAYAPTTPTNTILPASADTPSAQTINIPLTISGGFVVNGLYLVSASIVVVPTDVGNGIITSYLSRLNYNGVSLSNGLIQGNGSLTKEVCVPVVGFFKAVAGQSPNIDVDVLVGGSGGTNYRVSAISNYNIVRLN
jgi:hypothetical protein